MVQLDHYVTLTLRGLHICLCCAHRWTSPHHMDPLRPRRCPRCRSRRWSTPQLAPRCGLCHTPTHARCKLCDRPLCNRCASRPNVCPPCSRRIDRA